MFELAKPSSNRDPKSFFMKVRSFLQIYVDYVILTFIGLVIGIVTVVFYFSLNLLWAFTSNLITLPLLRIVLPTLGMLLSSLIVIKYARIKRTGSGTHEVLEAYYIHEGFIHPTDATSKLASSVLTIGLGGSAGPEGPSMLLGAGLSSWLGRKLKLSPPKIRLLSIIGAAASLAAFFRAPLTGILFSLEIPYKRDIESHVLIETIVASLSSYIIFVLIVGVERFYKAEFSFELSLPVILSSFLLGIICALTAIIFIEIYNFTSRKSRLIGLKYGLIKLSLLGGALVGLMSLIDPRILGTGHELIGDFVSGNVSTPALMILVLSTLKILATALTLNFGGCGGLFIPSLFIGAAVSFSFSQFFKLPFSQTMTAAGMAAFLAAVTKTPLTAVAFVAETCGPGAVIPTLITASISYLLSGNFSPFELQPPKRIEEEEQALEEAYHKLLTLNSKPLYSIKVFQIMNTHPISLKQGITIDEALNQISEYNYRVYPVVDENNNLIGYVKVEDLMGLINEEITLEITSLTLKPEVVYPEDSLGKAARMMLEKGVDHLFVVDKKGKLIGILAEIDIIRALLRELAKTRLIWKTGLKQIYAPHKS